MNHTIPAPEKVGEIEPDLFYEIKEKANTATCDTPRGVEISLKHVHVAFVGEPPEHEEYFPPPLIIGYTQNLDAAKAKEIYGDLFNERAEYFDLAAPLLQPLREAAKNMVDKRPMDLQLWDNAPRPMTISGINPDEWFWNDFCFAYSQPSDIPYLSTVALNDSSLEFLHGTLKTNFRSQKLRELAEYLIFLPGQREFYGHTFSSPVEINPEMTDDDWSILGFEVYRPEAFDVTQFSENSLVRHKDRTPETVALSAALTLVSKT